MFCTDTDTHTHTHTHTQTHTHRHRHTRTHAYTQAERQTDRQTNTHTHAQRNTHFDQFNAENRVLTSTLSSVGITVALTYALKTKHDEFIHVVII